MMRWIVRASLQSRFMVAVLAIGLAYFGLTQLRHLPLETLPEFSQPYVEIQTEAPGLSAAEVEALITVPLEADMLNGTAWVDQIRSQSIPGLSSIVLLFEPGTNVMRARQMVMERLTQVYTLPNAGKPPVLLNPVSSASRVMMIGLSSETMSPIEVSVLARWTIAPRLSGINGVANVSIWGERRRQLQVLVDPRRLNAAGITLQQMINTAGNSLWFSPLTFLNASTPGASGFIDTPNQRLGIRHQLPIATPEEFAQVTVDGTSASVGEVAQVTENHQPLIGDGLVDGQSNVILVVEKLPDANTLEVTRDIERTLDAMRPGLAGLHMDSTLFRPATYLEDAIENWKVAVFISAALMVVALGAFLLDARAAFIGSVAVLLSYLGAVSVLYLTATPLNAIVLAGLVVALGAVIDDAVVEVENMVGSLRKHRQEVSCKSFAKVIVEASLETRGTMLYATAILLLLLLPALAPGGVEGAFLRSVAVGYGLALLASMFVALTVTPALCMLLLPSSPLAGQQSAVVEQLQRLFNGAVRRIAEHPRKVVAVACLVALGGIASALLLQRDTLIPSFMENDLLVEMDSSPGTSLPAMTRVAGQAIRELRAIPGVRVVSAQVGRAVMSDHIGDVNTGKIWISLNDDGNYEDTVDRIQQVVDGYPGLDFDARTYFAACTDDVRGGPVGIEDGDIVVRVYGDDWKILKAKAEEIYKALGDIPGIVYRETELPLEEPQVEIQVRVAAAKQYGLKPGDVRRAAATLISGIEVGYLFEKQKVFDVVVWSVPEIRDNLTKIQNLRIDTPAGKQVALHEVADVQIRPAPTAIRREAVARYVDVAGTVKGRSIASVAKQVEQRLQEIEFPLEYRAELLRGAAERLVARNRLIGALVAVAIGVLLVLQACLGSWSLALTLLLTLPAALAGGVLVAWLDDGDWSLGVVLGLVATFTIAMRNVLRFTQNAQRSASPDDSRFSGNGAHSRKIEPPARTESTATLGDMRLPPELVLRTAGDQFAPVFTTAVVTAAAIAPFAVMHDLPGHETLHTVANVILGGLVTATMYTLFAIPAMLVLCPARRGSELDELLVSPISEEVLREDLTSSRAGVVERHVANVNS